MKSSIFKSFVIKNTHGGLTRKQTTFYKIKLLKPRTIQFTQNFSQFSYEENTNKYLNDITIYINNISDELDGYFSIKKELEYLLIVTEIYLNKSQYDNNSIVLDKYNEIFNSSLVSTSIKERVKKIHEFQLYK